MQLKTAAHEINHARMYDKLLKRYGDIAGHERWIKEGNNARLYASEEVIVERAATMTIRSVFEGKLTGDNLKRFLHALDDSKDYIGEYKKMM